MPDRSPFDAKLVRAEPFRFFFPLAFLLGVGGVGHWILYTTGSIQSYLAMFHAVTQMQSFLLAFATGFLLTALPKRTRSPEASWAEIAVLFVLLPLVSVATLVDAPMLGQLAYLGVLVMLAQFAARRFLARVAGRRPPASFVLVPIGFLAGVVGSALIVASLAGALGHQALWIGRAFTLRGMFLCLTLGVGSFFLPLATRGVAAADLDGSPRARRAALGYALSGLTVLAGLGLEESGFAVPGRSLYAAAALAVLLGSGAFRLPTKPGVNRRILWLGAWAVPLGLIAAAALPDHRVAALHITFIGGFGLLAFAVAAHVTLAHGGDASAQTGRPWPVLGFGVLFVLALAARASATSVPEHYFGLLGLAAALWLAGATLWAAYLVPRMWRGPLKG